MKYLLIISVLVFSIAGQLSSAANASQDPCLDCHEKKTPGIVDYWKKSMHFEKNIGCIDCHGSDIGANHSRKVQVDAQKCGLCHKAAFTSHSLSRHALGLKSGRGCTRNFASNDDRDKSCLFCHEPGSEKRLAGVDCAMFLAQSPEMRRQGCDSCHRVEVRCDACHTKHGTDLSVPKDPRTCGVCHMGPDHPQAEMWETSIHGVLYRQGKDGTAPSCATCHMDKGSHNVSRGITTGLPQGATERRNDERKFMLRICAGCHTSDLAESNLRDADSIEKQGAAIVEEAKKIIEGLQKDKLIFPSPAERPPHPLFGNEFVLGTHMLYENLSYVESRFFRLKQFYYPISYKGAFHQNPDYAHWYGNAPLKLTLSEIKSEAELLRQVDTIRKRLDNISVFKREEKGEIAGIRKKLTELQEKRLKGEISDKEYEKEKGKILDEKGL